jgi:hypothetical protein
MEYDEFNIRMMFNIVLYCTVELWIKIHTSWQIENSVEDKAYNYTVNIKIITSVKESPWLS